jgi:hypothetical protein
MLFWRTRFQLLDTDEAARIIDVPPRTLTSWRLSDRGPAFIRIGKRVKYDLEDVYAFIESQRRQTSDRACEGACGKRPAQRPDGERPR